MPVSPGTVYQVAQTQLGIGFESSKGTGVTPTWWLPVKAPTYDILIPQNPDEGIRGLGLKTFDQIAAIRHDELTWSGNPFLDSYPMLICALFGSADTKVAAPTATTLNGSAAAGATTITVASGTGQANGNYFTVGSGATLETHYIKSGGSTTTITLNTPLIYAQSNGAAVTFLTTHQFSTLYSTTTQNQPPSATLNYYNGEENRQLVAAQLESLNMKWSASGLLEYDTKFLSFPATSISTPSQTLTTASTPAGWTGEFLLDGSVPVGITEGEFNFGRGTQAVETQTGSQNPFAINVGPLENTGKLTAVEQSGSPLLSTDYVQGQPHTFDATWYDLSTGFALNFHYTSAKLITGQLNPGKDWWQVDLGLFGKANSTDATPGGGLSPCIVTIANTTTTTYH